MKKSRKLLTLILVLVMLLGVSTNVFATKFPDATNHWAAKYIEWATDSNLVEGYPDGTFKPQGQITQAEFYKMVNRLADYKEKATVNYTDVKASDWFYDEVARGVKAGYLKNSATTLYPNSAITRDEASRIVAFIYGLKDNTSATNVFTDASSILNRGAVGALVDKKIIHGYPNKTFKPLGTLTRAEFTKILYTAVHNLGLPTLYKAQTTTPKPVTPAPTTSCPYPTEWAALKKAVDDGNYYLGRQSSYNPTPAEITELRNAVSVGQSMLNVYNRSGYNYNYRNIVNREYRSFEDFYTINSSVFNSRVDARTFWDTYSYYGNNGNYYLRDSWTGGYNWSDRTFTNWTDFYNYYKGTYTYSQILDMWNSGNYRGSTSCPYTRQQIVDATERIKKAINNYTDNIGYYDYVVSFNSMGGSSVASQRIVRGNTVTRPTNPTRAGYTFGGWYTDSYTTTPYNFSTRVYNSFTLYARWIPTDQVTVYFRPNNDTIPFAEVVKVGNLVNKPADPVRPGYKFLGWFTGAGNLYDFTKPVYSSFTLDARWQAVTSQEYTITVKNPTGATIKTTPANKAKAGDSVTVTVNITDTTQVLDKITVTDSSNNPVTVTDNKFIMPAKAVTVTATLKDKPVETFKVTFDTDGGVPTGKDQFVPKGGQATEPQNPTKTGYVFRGWFEGNATNPFDFDTAINKDLNLKAKWLEEVTVTFSFKNGEPNKVIKLGKGEKVTAFENPTRAGYVFIGWFLGESNDPYTFDTPINSNITVTAGWVEEKEYTITITPPEGGTVTTTPASKAKNGSLVKLNITPPAGKEIHEIKIKEENGKTFTVPQGDLSFIMPSANVTITVTFL